MFHGIQCIHILSFTPTYRILLLRGIFIASLNFVFINHEDVGSVCVLSYFLPASYQILVACFMAKFTLYPSQHVKVIVNFCFYMNRLLIIQLVIIVRALLTKAQLCDLTRRHMQATSEKHVRRDLS